MRERRPRERIACLFEAKTPHVFRHSLCRYGAAPPTRAATGVGRLAAGALALAAVLIPALFDRFISDIVADCWPMSRPVLSYTERAPYDVSFFL